MEIEGVVQSVILKKLTRLDFLISDSFSQRIQYRAWIIERPERINARIKKTSLKLLAYIVGETRADKQYRLAMPYLSLFSVFRLYNGSKFHFLRYIVNAKVQKNPIFAYLCADMYSLDNFDTICAISTPAGSGGIAVCRVSGKDAFSIVDKIRRGKSLNELESHSAHLTDIFDPDSADKTPLDSAVVTLFRGPKSFTGEDVVEISVHGSTWIQRELINLLVRQGCRIAEAGEFTRRAFANGRLDLAQAEAVADVIAASSRSAHRLAAMQMRGDFSNRISTLRDKLIEIASLLELELDFSEEEVEFASREHLKNLSEELYRHISRLAASFSTGSVLKDGVPVAIVGEPNVGKSTLLNALLGDNRAIVSDIPGTTRDTIEDTIEIDGVLYRFIDTAGIRETADTVENLGIERSFSSIGKAKIVLLMVTPETGEDKIEQLRKKVAEHLHEDSSMLLVVNKTDKVEDYAPIPHSIPISASKGTNMSALMQALGEHSGASEADGNEFIVTNARHYEALLRAKESIRRVIHGLESSLSGDFIAQDLRETIHHLSTITGEITTTDLLSSIFSKFCIGK